MPRTTRREILKAAALGAIAACMQPESVKGAQPETTMTNIPPAFAPQHTAKPLGFDPAKLKGLSERLIVSHWENNYGASVKALNTIKQRLLQALADPETPPFVYNDLKREHLMRTGSVVLHELYFDNLSGDGQPDEPLRHALAANFGSFDTWETEFRRMAQGLGGGSGWVVLGHNLHTGLLENYWMWDHLHGPVHTAPLIVMDMYEHSYHLDYGAAAAKYVDAFFLNIRWEAAAARLARANSGKTI